jgi:hypothetical protein
MIEIPIDYKSIFKDRVLIITGVGRSGTTILGKLIGSMKPTYYLFEPAIMKYMLSIDFDIETGNGQKELISAIRGVLLEDYFLPQIQGRNLNHNKKDDSYYGHYYTGTLDAMWNSYDLSRRKDAIKYIEQENPLFIIKTNEFQPLLNIARRIFRGVKFIHIIRNGNDVIQSTLKKGWYSDEYMENQIVDWVERRNENNIPWYIDDVSKNLWYHWNRETRIACVWRCLVEKCKEDYDDTFVIHYEYLLTDPEGVILSLTPVLLEYRITEITKRHIEAIKSYKKSNYPKITNKIEQPERDKFCKLMEKLWYEW